MALWTSSLRPSLASQTGDSGTKRDSRRKDTSGEEKNRTASWRVAVRPMLTPARRPRFTTIKRVMVKRPRSRTRDKSVSKWRQAGSRQPQAKPEKVKRLLSKIVTGCNFHFQGKSHMQCRTVQTHHVTPFRWGETGPFPVAKRGSSWIWTTSPREWGHSSASASTCTQSERLEASSRHTRWGQRDRRNFLVRREWSKFNSY